MKKTTAIAFALGLTMLLSGTACAETSADAAVFVEPVRTGESEYLDWIDSGWNWLSGKLESGYEYLTGPVAEEAGRTIAAWRKTVEDYLMNSQWPEEVRSAWNTLREAAEDIGSVTAEEATEAYRVVRDWIVSTGVLTDEDVAAALDWLAEAAGVTEAAVSEWYRTVETYFSENRDAMSETVREAWNTIREAQAEGTELAEEALNSAYQAIYDWINSTDSEDAAQAAEAMEHIMDL